MSELILGSWNVICDQCGVKRKAHQVTERWDKLIVCRPEVRKGCYETRHPQDFVRAKHDDQSVSFSRPDSDTNPVTGEPVLSSVPTFNCNSLEAIYLSSHFAVSTTIVKAIIMGPAIVDDGVTITIRCSLEVR